MYAKQKEKPHNNADFDFFDWVIEKLFQITNSLYKPTEKLRNMLFKIDKKIRLAVVYRNAGERHVIARYKISLGTDYSTVEETIVLPYSIITSLSEGSISLFSVAILLRSIVHGLPTLIYLEKTGERFESLTVEWHSHEVGQLRLQQLTREEKYQRGFYTIRFEALEEQARQYLGGDLGEDYKT